MGRNKSLPEFGAIPPGKTWICPVFIYRVASFNPNHLNGIDELLNTEIMFLCGYEALDVINFTIIGRTW